MKKMAFIGLLFINSICFAQTSSDIIGNPIKILNLLVAEFDFPEKMNWISAEKKCRELGKGWRLPTENELDILYKYRDKIGGFSPDGYWSSTVNSNRTEVAYCQDFSDGKQYRIFPMSNTFFVRAIKVP